MNTQDRADYIRRYTERYERFGYDPRTLGWGRGGRQRLRFAALMEITTNNEGRVLDVGCGFGDLYGYLSKVGWRGHYVGVDVVPVLIKEARVQYPGIDVRLCDILTDEIEDAFDYVMASGVFNAKLSVESNEFYIEKMIRRMVELAGIGVAVDFMSSHVDFQNGKAWHTDPVWLMKLAFRLTRRVVIRHDYMPYEFCAYFYPADRITRDSVYAVGYDENGRVNTTFPD